MFINFKTYWQKLPDLSLSHILLRIPLALMFIGQGLSKFPFDPAVGAGFGLPALVWWFVCYGEVAAGIGLLAGGLATIPRVRDIPSVAVIGDMTTRFSGIVMCCIATGVIWTVLKPESLLTFIMTDYMHFSLWAGGLYFGLRGNWAVAVDRK
jgi:putative oxidoreductase